MAGPLQGLRFIEIGGIGPGPFCGMMLADMGADVIAVHKPGHVFVEPMQMTERGKRSITLDFKKPEDIERVLKLCKHADGLFEGFRPGVMERLGLAPEHCFTRNPKLVYGRLSGFGQDGPLAQTAGHDLNFLAVAGILDLVRGRDGHPAIPANLIADYGGGSLYMSFGLLCAVLSAQRTGKGQVVDLALSEGAASLASIFFGGPKSAILRTVLTGTSPFFHVYETADAGYMSVAAIEPLFYARFLEVMGLSTDSRFADQIDTTQWPSRIQILTELFLKLTRDEWATRFANVDCCVVPVNMLSEVAEHPQMKARGNFMTLDGMTIPGPTPRFSGTPASTPTAPHEVGSDTEAVFKEFGL